MHQLSRTLTALRGICDVSVSILQIREEVGFEVSPRSLEEVTTYVSAVGTSGSVHHMFSAEVDESMRIDGGGGLQ